MSQRKLGLTLLVGPLVLIVVVLIAYAVTQFALGSGTSSESTLAGTAGEIVRTALGIAGIVGVIGFFVCMPIGAYVLVNNRNVFSMSKAFENGWSTTKKYFLLYWGANFLTIGIFYCVSLLSTYTSKMIENTNVSLVITFVGGLISYAILYILSAGLYKMYVEASRGNAIQFKMLFGSSNVAVKFFLSSILISLISLAGLFLFIIPGIIWGIKYSQVPYLIVDKNLGVFAALKESARLTYGAKWDLLGFSMFNTLIGFLGLLAIMLGLFIAVPLIAFASANVYLQLVARDGNGVLNSSTTNNLSTTN